MIILGTNSIKATGFDVANSCRFNDGSSDYLTRTPSSSGNRDKYTLSFWFKRSGIGTVQKFFNAKVDGSNFTEFGFESSDVMQIYNYNSGSVRMLRETNRVFRDVSAWYHLVLKYDSSQSTASDRFKIYINGVEETSFSSSTEPALNEDSNLNVSSAVNTLGRSQGDTYYFDGYMAEVVLLDGTALAADSFGEFDSDSGIWKPIDVSGLTFGNNGYYLDFADSGDLGDDESGNGNDFAETNLAATDQSTDTCTNNFMTFSPLYGTAGKTFSEGNLKYSYANNYQRAAFGSITPELGKWYFEFKNDSNKVEIAVCNNVIGTDGRWGTDTSGNATYRLQNSNNAVTWVTSSSEGRMSQNGSNSRTDLARVADGEIGMYAFDLATGKIWTGKGGNWDNSGNPATGANPSATWSTNFTANTPTWFAFGKEGGFVVEVNFGSPPYAISSSNTDGDGHGNFEYAVPSGYFSLCTKNLAEYG